MLTHSTSLFWIARHFKCLSCPIVIVSESLSQVSAYYDWDFGSVVRIDEQEVFNRSGIIVLSAADMVSEEPTILHEFRHHLQVQLNGKWCVPDWDHGEDLTNYLNCSFEKDARLFEVSLGRTDEHTDRHKTTKVARSIMLSLPTPSFLKGVGRE